MKIVVCINHLPDTASEIILDAEKKSINESEITFILNPFDEYAIEEALKLKEENGGEVIVMSVGDESFKESIKKALAMGADRAVLIKGDKSLDSHNIASALADEITETGADVVLLGKQSVDYDNSVIGPMIAEISQLNSISLVSKLEINGTDIKAKREIEGGKEIIETSLPVLITVGKGINEPRYPTIKGIKHAKDKPLIEKNFVFRENLVDVIELQLPPENKTCEIIGTDISAVPRLIDLLKKGFNFI